MTSDSSTQHDDRRNVGTVDRIVSGILGAGMLALGIWQATRSPWRLFMGILGPPLIVRAALGRCGLYRALGIDTCHRRPPQADTADTADTT